MARTWTLTATKTGTTGGINYYATFDNSFLYFVFEGVVYRWSADLGFVDISGSTFSALSVNELAVFNNRLYARIISGGYPSYTPYVYRYNDSGTSWTQVWAGSALSITSSSAAGDLEADSSRLVIYNRHNGGIDVHASTNGTAWIAQTAIGGSFGDTTGPMLGRCRKTAGGFDEVVIHAGGNVWQYNTLGDWQKLNAGSLAAGASQLTGFADGKSWWRKSTSGVLQYSTNWGVTLTDAAGSGFGITTVWVQTLQYELEAFQISSGAALTLTSTTWADDGAPGSGNIYLLFFINNIIYALVNNGVNAEIYSGGSIPPLVSYARFYQGIDGLAERSQLPAGVTGVLPDGLLIKPCGMAVIGSRAANAIMVAQADPAVDYAVWDDLTGSLDTANGITALRLIQ